MFQRARGTRDFLPEEMRQRRAVEMQMRLLAERAGYGEVCTPVFENLELFTIRSGENIVKELYAFEDKGGRNLALRPEVTAAVLRMYVNEGKAIPKPLRWYYVANCFRYERPQKGRYREFWQFGVELIGADTALADAEVIMLAEELLRCSGVSFTLQVGHLAPMKYLLSTLREEEQRTMMAFLDKRDFAGMRESLVTLGREDLEGKLGDLAAARDLDEVFTITGLIPEEERIRETCSILDSNGCRYSLNFGIARGLDYYTGMVFEGFAENLGAENQILGGGAYRLAHLFGGEDVPSCGFAVGFDRVMVSRGQVLLPEKRAVGIISVGEGRKRVFVVARAFREAGVRAEVMLTVKGVGAQIAQVARIAGFAVVIGDREAREGMVTLKDLKSGVQRTCSLAEAVEEVTRP
ncbi:MAG: histidine--tRNA ligase [Methanomicrobiales archaeon]|nr:histidine--tRNA ligase [Methanomicrobiales archaeon]